VTDELNKVEENRRQLYKWKGFLSCSSLKTEAVHRLLCSWLVSTNRSLICLSGVYVLRYRKVYVSQIQKALRREERD